MSVLIEIQKFLEEKNQASTLVKPSEKLPYEHILVAFENTIDKQTDLLEITALQLFENPQSKENNQSTYHILQFQFVLPTSVPPENFNEVSSCLHFFNRLLHCPGFELDEISDRILYRYVWFIKKEGIDAFLLMQVLANIHLCFKMFSPYIQTVAEGKYKLKDILEQVIQLSQQKS